MPHPSLRWRVGLMAAWEDGRTSGGPPAALALDELAHLAFRLGPCPPTGTQPRDKLGVTDGALAEVRSAHAGVGKEAFDLCNKGGRMGVHGRPFYPLKRISQHPL